MPIYPTTSTYPCSPSTASGSDCTTLNFYKTTRSCKTTSYASCLTATCSINDSIFNQDITTIRHPAATNASTISIVADVKRSCSLDSESIAFGNMNAGIVFIESSHCIDCPICQNYGGTT